ncbi:TSL-kinase interacting protein 1 [Raphanus sativus]|nr:TSL-kinase interacting protein 1 [Raphanus sativus]
MGDLLSEVPDDIDCDCVDPPTTKGSHCLLGNVSFASDSFHAAHILRHQNKPSAPPPVTFGYVSLWDDEDTRDTFSFRFADSPTWLMLLLLATSGDEGACNPPGRSNGRGSNFQQTLWALKGSVLPDSLGPLDLDTRSSKYTEDLNLSESLGGLSRLIATSLDAFQNCSLFGFDSKKDKSNMI